MAENWWEEDKLVSEEANWWEEDDLADSEIVEKDPSIGELTGYGFDKGEADYEKWAAGTLASIDDPELRNIMGSEIGISSEFGVRQSVADAALRVGTSILGLPANISQALGSDPVTPTSAELNKMLKDKGISSGEGFTKKSGIEIYGEEFADNIDRDRRLELIKQKSLNDIKEEHPEILAWLEKNKPSTGQQAAMFLGEGSKALLSPTTLFIAGKGLWGSVATGWGLGTQLSAAEQFKEEGKVDVVDAATSPEALIGAAAGFGAFGVTKIPSFTRKAAKKIREIQASKPLTTKQQDKLASKINTRVVELRKKGVPQGQAETQAQAMVGATNQRMSQIGPKVVKVTDDDLSSIAKQEAATEAARSPASVKARKIGTKVKKIPEQIGGIVSTRVANISKPVAARLKRHDFNVSSGIANLTTKIEPFSKIMKKIEKTDVGRQVKSQMLNGDLDDAYLTLQSNGFDGDSVYLVKEVMDELYKDATDVGIDMGYVSGYVPRKVKDVGLLRKSLGTDVDEFDIFLKKRMEQDGLEGELSTLEDAQAAKYFNEWFSGERKLQKGMGFQKQRTVSVVGDDLIDFYDDIPNSIDYYITKVVKEREKREFFGKGKVDKATDGSIDTKKSVGTLAREDTSITPEKRQELSEILEARFVAGERPVGDVAGMVRDVQTITLLGNPAAAAIQLADIAISTLENGIINTFKGLYKRDLTAEQLGVISNISQDIASNGPLSDSVQFFLKWSGFRAVDKLGKDTFINAALLKGRNIVTKNPKKFKQIYGDKFNGDVDELMRDLASGKVTDNVKLFAWNELSGVQPISLSEVPEAYLNMSNGRLFYTLKSWAIKQLDVLRRQSVGKMVQGAKSKDIKKFSEGAKYLAGYSALVLPAQATVQELRKFMRTGEFASEKLGDRYVEAMMNASMVGSKYNMSTISRGEYGQTIIDIAAPPILGIMDRVGRAAYKGDPYAAGKYLVPPIGDFAYNWFGGGAEKILEREAKEERKKNRSKRLF